MKKNEFEIKLSGKYCKWRPVTLKEMETHAHWMVREYLREHPSETLNLTNIKTGETFSVRKYQ